MPWQQAREPADAADDGAGVFARHGRRDGGLDRTAGDPATPGQTEQGRRGYRQGRLEGQDQSNGGGAGEAGAQQGYRIVALAQPAAQRSGRRQGQAPGGTQDGPVGAQVTQLAQVRRQVQAEGDQTAEGHRVAGG